MRWWWLAALVFLTAACGPTKPTDARDFEPSAIPEGGPQPWEKGTKKPTATVTPTLVPTETPAPSPTPTPRPAATPTIAPAPPAAAPAGAVMTPAALKARIQALQREGMDQDLILAYVNRQKLEPRMTVDDILDWKRSGIADDLIKAAANR